MNNHATLMGSGTFHRSWHLNMLENDLHSTSEKNVTVHGVNGKTATMFARVLFL